MKKQNRVAFFNILSTVILNVLPLITATLFTRLLGTSGYGILATYNIWVAAAAIVCPLQSQGSLVNARIEYNESEQLGYQSSVMTLSMAAFALWTVLTLAFLKPISQALALPSQVVLIMLAQSFGTFCVSFFGTKLIYELKAGRNMLLSVGVALATFGVSLVLVLRLPQDSRYLGRIWGNASVYALTGVGLCGYILGKGKVFYNRTYWKFCLSLSVPLMFYNLSGLLLGYCDQLMVRGFLGNSQAGIYGFAYQFAGVMFAIFGALNNTWVPFFFNDKKAGDTEKILSQAKNFMELFTILSMGFVLLTPEVFHLLASSDYWPGTELIPLFVTGHYLNFLCTFPVNVENYHKKVRVVAAVTVTSSLLNMVLNYFLIHAMGTTGAVLATVISHVFQLIFHYLYCTQRLEKTDYAFPVRRWGAYALAFFAALGISYLPGKFWILRWGIGAVLGVWELLRIRRRKVLL